MTSCSLGSPGPIELTSLAHFDLTSMSCNLFICCHIESSTVLSATEVLDLSFISPDRLVACPSSPLIFILGYLHLRIRIRHGVSATPSAISQSEPRDLAFVMSPYYSHIETPGSLPMETDTSESDHSKTGQEPPQRGTRQFGLDVC